MGKYRRSDLSLQLDAFKIEGCDDKHIFNDKISGATSQRVGLDACLSIVIEKW